MNKNIAEPNEQKSKLFNADILDSIKSKLFNADTLDSIVKEALKQLKELIGYDRAIISLVDKDLKRYLLKFDSVDLPYNKPQRKLIKNISGDTLIKKVNENTAFIISNFDKLHETQKGKELLASWGWTEEASTEDIKSWIGLAAKYKNEAIAIITLDQTKADVYQHSNNELIDFLKNFGGIFAVAITKLFSQRKEKAVVDILTGIGNKLKSEELVKDILTKLQKVLNCDSCTYFSVSSGPDEQGEFLKDVFLKEWISAKGYPEERKKHIYKKGVGIAGNVLKDGQSRIVPNAIEYEEFSPSLNHSGDGLSMLVIPVISIDNKNTEESNRIIGVISCYKEDKPDHFTIYDRNLVEHIVLSIAPIIERTMILEYFSEISSEMTQLVLSLDKDSLFETILKHTLKITSAPSASIHRLKYDLEKYIYIAGEYYSYPREEDHPRLDGTGTTDLVIKTGTTQEFSKKLGNSELIKEKDVQVKIVVPLMITKDNQKEIIGALYVKKYVEKPFSLVERFALELFAKQAASIINEQEILAEKTLRDKAHEKFVEAAIKISESDDIDLLLRNVAQYAYELSSSCEFPKTKTISNSLRFVDIFMDTMDIFNENKLGVKAAWPEYRLIDLKNKHLEEKKTGIIYLAVERKEPICINNIKEKTKEGAEYYQKYIECEEKSNSELAVPIINLKDGKVIGVINIEHSELNAFTKLHIEIIKHFARQVAIAYQKKSLVTFIENNNKTLDSLHRSLPSIMSEPPQNILYKAVSAVREALKAEKVIIIPIEADSVARKLVIPIGKIVPLTTDNASIEVLKQISLDVYENGTKSSNSTKRDFNFGEPKISYGLCLSFFAGSKKIGVMWILFSKLIDEKQIEKNTSVYQAYANQIALAYENANQLESLKNKDTNDLSEESKKHYKNAQKEAVTYFGVSLASAVIGLVIIFTGVSMSLKSDSNKSLKSLFFSLSGLLLQGVTVLAFNRGAKANERSDKLHEERVNIGKLNILLAATEQLNPESNMYEEKKRIIQITTDNWIPSTGNTKSVDKKVNEIKSTIN